MHGVNFWEELNKPKVTYFSSISAMMDHLDLKKHSECPIENRVACFIISKLEASHRAKTSLLSDYPDMQVQGREFVIALGFHFIFPFHSLYSLFSFSHTFFFGKYFVEILVWAIYLTK